MRLRKNLSIIIAVCVLCCLGILSGCSLFELKDELKGLDYTYRMTGKLQGSWDKDKPLVAVLYRKDKEQFKIAEYVIPDPEGHYVFFAHEGVYLLVVFEDINQDFIYEDGELFGFANQAKPIVPKNSISPGAKSRLVPRLDVELVKKTGFPEGLPTLVDINTFSGKSYIKVGEVRDLDDPIFAKENGYKGYWKPLSFLRDVGAGIYFLEKYDPQKIPVLFVHGANGTPVGWKPYVEQLDRNMYQPWFFYYPSGIHMEKIASALNHMIHSLDENYKLKKMVVVASSMGGLVSRAFILKNAIEDKQNYIYKFISISTPWGGVSTAALGVKQSPVVMPNWIDVEPESKFIKYLYSQHLPKTIDFYLLFGVRGKCSYLMENNDGTIEIASELDYRAQNEAKRIFGYNEDHDSILTSPEVLDRFHSLMQ
jgi:pimeloyl-ACP methyl ester carboxylesterase